MASLKDQAIQLALDNKWQDACDINLQILEDNPDDIDTLNRLTFSYIKLSQLENAKKTCNRVLEIDKTNPIAQKNLHKIEGMNFNNDNDANQGNMSTYGVNNLYIEEAGKTKTIELKNIADKKTLSRLQAGEIVNLTVKRSKIFIQTLENQYIGMLPDSVGMRLVELIKGGNEYQASIKSLNDKNISVFIREIKRSAQFKNQPSFISATRMAKA